MLARGIAAGKPFSSRPKPLSVSDLAVHLDVVRGDKVLDHCGQQLIGANRWSSSESGKVYAIRSASVGCAECVSALDTGGLRAWKVMKAAN